MKIAITGALGHIGSRFIHDLTSEDELESVLLIDDLSTQRYSSLFSLPQGVPFRFVEADICEAELGTLFREMDVVIHLAAITDASNSVTWAEHVHHVNEEGTARVARACMENGSRMIFLSTTSVYGPQTEVVDENTPDEALHPQSPYAWSKLAAETRLRQLGGQGLRFLICRFGTIFGISPGMRFHTAINSFLWRAATNRPLSVWRTALDQVRPYLAVEDGSAALRFILERDLFDNGVYDVVTCNCTVREIIDLVRSEFPTLEIELVDSPIMNQHSYSVAGQRLRALGFHYCGDLARGIRDTAELLRNASAGA
jgi:UDP-glucose 4-epimerase